MRLCDDDDDGGGSGGSDGAAKPVESYENRPLNCASLRRPHNNKVKPQLVPPTKTTTTTTPQPPLVIAAQALLRNTSQPSRQRPNLRKQLASSLLAKRNCGKSIPTGPLKRMARPKGFEAKDTKSCRNNGVGTEATIAGKANLMVLIALLASQLVVWAESAQEPVAGSYYKASFVLDGSSQQLDDPTSSYDFAYSPADWSQASPSAIHYASIASAASVGATNDLVFGGGGNGYDDEGTASAVAENSASNSNEDDGTTAIDDDDKLDNFQPPKTPVDAKLARQACHKYRGAERRDKFNDTYLRHCNRYKFHSLLDTNMFNSIWHDPSEECERIVREFIQLDEMIRHFDNMFRKLLSRYNCHNGYSVKWNCDDCKRAYTDWLCATSLPHYMNGVKIRPCISFCERVEQRCPYLHPITKEQYGGQPVFICRDPNIPYVPEITPDIPYGDPYQCYDLCHISDNMTELFIDSLSKYDVTGCPRKEDIATKSLMDSAVSSSGRLQDNGLASLQNYHQPTQWVPVHVRKLKELKDVLANYRAHSRGHGFHHYTEHAAAFETPSEMHHQFVSSF